MPKGAGRKHKQQFKKFEQVCQVFFVPVNINPSNRSVSRSTKCATGSIATVCRCDKRKTADGGYAHFQVYAPAPIAQTLASVRVPQCHGDRVEVGVADVQRCVRAGHRLMVLMRGLSGAGKTYLAR